MLILNLYWSTIISCFHHPSSVRFVYSFNHRQQTMLWTRIYDRFSRLMSHLPIWHSNQETVLNSQFLCIDYDRFVCFAWSSCCNDFHMLLMRFSSLFLAADGFKSRSCQLIMKSSRVGSFWIDLTNLFIHSAIRLQTSAILVFDDVSWLFHDSLRRWFKFSTSSRRNFEEKRWKFSGKKLRIQWDISCL